MQQSGKEIQKSYISNSEEDTYQWARQFAAELQAGDIVCLDGELGSGKTRIVKGMAPRFGLQRDDISSPTFTLIHEYHENGNLPLYHFDCYRMEHVEEAVEIGAEEYLYGEGITVIEWPDRILELLTGTGYWVQIETLDATTRQFFISTFRRKFNNF